MTFTECEGHGPLILFKLDKQICMIYNDSFWLIQM